MYIISPAARMRGGSQKVREPQTVGESRQYYNKYNETEQGKVLCRSSELMQVRSAR